MLGALAASFCLAGVAPAGRAAQEGALLPFANRTALRGIATELSKLGLSDELARVQEVLERGGDDPDALAKLRRTWDRNLARDPGRTDLRPVRKKLVGELRDLAQLVERAEGETRERLVALVLALDSQHPRANELAGRTLLAGRWLGPAELAIAEHRERIAEWMQSARRLEIEVETGESASPVLEKLHGERGILARALGVSVHARGNPEKLARVLRQALRAAALSRALVEGVLAPPRFQRKHEYVLLGSADEYPQAVDEACANGGIDPKDREVDLGMRSFEDRRGWRTSRWRVEADLQAFLLWQLLEESLGPGVQPCLEAGHLNWLALGFLGTSMPTVAWQDRVAPGEPSARTSSRRETPFQAEVLWRCARSSFHGCRSWMLQRVLAGRDPPWARSMVDHVGKVSDEDLLKSTLVVAYLHELGSFPKVLAATRAATERVASFEAALEMPLPDFDARWASWLLGETEVPGVLQMLGEPAAEPAPEQAVVVDELNRVRRLALAGQHAEFESVAADDELSAGAVAHARYLALNPAQKDAWPDAHEQYSDREGFTPEGAQAGLRSVIAFTEDPRDALRQWMGTFYHRLPLLEPGLIGVGYGQEAGIAVLDVASLVLTPWRDHWVVWPHDGMRDVPLSFVPELPNPVPGEELAALGYPVTLQISLAEPRVDLALGMELRESGGAVVDCWFLSPEAPLFRELAPGGAWCLIPKAHLKPRTDYAVTAALDGGATRKDWRFRTE